jgi:hypothetical protein
MARQGRAEHLQVILARSMLAMTDGVGNNELARQFKMDRCGVHFWHNRWLELMPKLITTEAFNTAVSEL